MTKKKNEPSADDFAEFCKKKKDDHKKSANYIVDKKLIAKARFNLAPDSFTDSCEKFLEERGELTPKQRDALDSWGEEPYDYGGDGDDCPDDHSYESFGEFMARHEIPNQF